MILTLHLFIKQVPIRIPVPSAASPCFLLIALIEATLFRRLFSLIWLGRLWVHSMRRWRIYLETTPTLYPHVGPILLASSSGSVLEAVFDKMSLFPLKSWDAEDMVILGCVSKLFGLSLLVISNYPPWHGPWALVESGSGRKFSGPTVYKRQTNLWNN